MQPRADFARAIAGSAPAAPAPGLLGECVVHNGDDEHAATQQLEEPAARDFEVVDWRGVKFITLRLDLVFVEGFHFASPSCFAALRMAVTIRPYVPQRQMFPSIARTISISDGLGFLFSSESADMIMPGVQ